MTIVSFIIIFTVVVVSHEFGHYLIARLNGIRVNEFSIGMGPALFRKKGKMTEVVIRLLPIGGACIFEGEDGKASLPDGEEETEDGEKTEKIDKELKSSLEAKSFQEAPVWARIASVFAGPVFNVILAYLLSLVIVWFCGADLPVVGSVLEGYPAEAAGIQEGDTIIKIDNLHTHLWREIMVHSYMSSGREMSITYLRDGQKYTTTLTPRYDEAEGRYYIGFSGGAEYEKCNNVKVLKYSWFEVRYWLVATVESLKYMVSGHAALDDLAGPVGVANIIDDTIEETKPMGAFLVVLNMLNIAVLLSVNLGVLNLLPIPALDGGRLLFLLFEAVSGRKIPPEKEGIVHLIGFVLLMILMLVVLFNDIGRFFK
ncbi:MAG: RIP metalloprotease RseP [Lachnospiraceae bacterium]|nr:RIP metalloprotease RseP [Lachnospiraceae bacterium]